VPIPTPSTFIGLRVFISYPRGGHAQTWAEHVEADLKQRGAEVFRDVTGIAEGDDSWYQRIVNGLTNAHVVASVVGQHSDNCKWQTREMLKADHMALPAVAFRVDAVALPLYMAEKQPVELRAGQHAECLQRLADALAAKVSTRIQPGSVHAALPTGPQRQRELAYLNSLLHKDLSTHESRYVPVAGQVQQANTLERSLKGLRMPTSTLLQAFKQKGGAAAMPDQPPVPYGDVLDAYLALPTQRIRRMAVLGEPGAGKSFSLERLAAHHARVALQDPKAPVPLLVRLGLWTREDSLQSFVQQQMGSLVSGFGNSSANNFGDSFATLLDQGRAVLLLDGLNEIPPGQRSKCAPWQKTNASPPSWSVAVNLTFKMNSVCRLTG
jgi:TIR domain